MHEKGPYEVKSGHGYAFRMVLHMALLPSGTKLTGSVLAEQELIPRTIFAQDYA